MSARPAGATSSWATPDAGRGPLPPTAPPRAPAGAAAGPGARADAGVGLVTVVALVLLGAPAGLLWATIAPRVSVLLSDTSVMILDPDQSAFIAGDGVFLGVVFAVGLVTGALAWTLGRRQAQDHGPAVVLGLAAGGLLAGYVTAQTGALLDQDAAREAVAAGRSGVVELAVRLRASEAVVGWPVGALLGFLAPALLRRP